MKNNFRFGAIVLLIFTMLGLSACGSIQDKAAEKAAEKMIEQGTGGKVDISNGGVKFESQEGSFEAGENLKWPKDLMGDLPEPKAKITAVVNGNDGKSCTVAFSEMDPDDARDYSQKLVEMGFKNGMSMTDEESIMLTGERDDGSNASFIYNVPDRGGTVSYATE